MVPMSNILQSEIWARFQESNGHTVIRRSGEGWSYIATVEGGKTGRYLYSPYGPVAEDAQTFDAALTSLKAEAKAHKCRFSLPTHKSLIFREVTMKSSRG